MADDVTLEAPVTSRAPSATAVRGALSDPFGGAATSGARTSGAAAGVCTARSESHDSKRTVVS